MGQTRMFRDRVVSMEQTLEGGEKHLPVLKDLCREALPELEFVEHSLDHERDLFVMDFRAASGARTRVCWTRMVLFDAERIPTLTGDPASALRLKIIDLLRSRRALPEIVVTFRHLEEGWVDTPEPRREGRRRRRGGRATARGPERGAPERRPGPAGAREQRPGQRPGQRPAGGPPPRPPSARGGAATAPRPAPAPSRPPAEPGTPVAEGKRRRRFRRRRGRGRGPGAGSGPAGPPGTPPSGAPNA